MIYNVLFDGAHNFSAYEPVNWNRMIFALNGFGELGMSRCQSLNARGKFILLKDYL